RGKPACPQWLAGHPLRPALLAAKHLLTTICLRSLAPPHKRARAQEGLFARCRRRQLTGPPSQNGRYINPCILSPLLGPDRKSTRLNSSHVSISYAVFCLKKKNKLYITTHAPA